MPPIGVRPGQLREAERRPAPTPARSLPATRPAPAYHPPMVYAPQQPARSFGSFPSSHPFARAQQQAAQRVSRAVPQQRIYAPQLPAVPNPTIGQQYTAFAEAQRFQEQHLGANPTRQRELQFHREVQADPRNAHFIQALAHYLHAANVEGSKVTTIYTPHGQPSDAHPFLAGEPGGARNVIDAAVSASRQESPNERARREGTEQAWAKQGQAMLLREAREKQQHQGDVSLGLATINPSHLAAATLGKLATINPLPSGSGLLGELGKAGNEVLDLPGQIALSTAMLGGAAGQWLLHKNSQPAGQLAEAIANQVADPVKSFKEAPVGTALVFGGLQNALFRSLARGARLGAWGALKVNPESASAAAVKGALNPRRTRPDILLYGEPGAPETIAAQGGPAGRGFTIPNELGREGVRVSGRTINKDPLREALATLYERHKYQRSEAVPGAYQASPKQVKRLAAGGVFKVGTADLAASGIERTRRGMVRGITNTAITKLVEKEGELRGLKPKSGAAAVGHMVENTIRSHVKGEPATSETIRADVQGLIDQWKAKADEVGANGNHLLVGEDRALNHANIRALKGLLSDKTFMEGGFREALTAAERFKALQKPSLVTRLFGGVLDEGQLRAGFFPYAQRYMGAKFHTANEHEAAEQAALQSFGQHRADQVSGRDEVGLRNHRGAKEQLDMAAENVKTAEGGVAKTQRAYDRRVALQQSARARGEGPPRASTPAERAAMEKATQQLKAAKQARKEARAEHSDARATADANPLPPRKAAMRGPHGEVLTTQMILDDMAEHGLSPPGFISHVRGAAGRGSYYKRIIGGSTPTASHPRTGAAFERGLVDYSWPGLAGTLAKHASEAAQLEGRWRVYKRLGFGPHETRHSAQEAAHNFHADPAGEALAHDQALGRLRVVHVGSGKVASSELAAESQPTPTEAVLRQLGLEQHTKVMHRELGKFILVPEHVHERLLEHESALTSHGPSRELQAYQQAWRRAKLNTSVPHIFGVMQEQAIRLLMEQAGPMSWGAGRKWDRNMKTMAEVDEHGYAVDDHGPLGRYWRSIEAVVGGRGGLTHSQRWTDIRTKADRMQETSTRRFLNRAGTGVVKGAAEPLRSAWRGYRLPVEGILSKVEQAAYHAHLGKQLKASGLIDSMHSLLRAQDDVVQALIEDRMNQNLADALARKVDDAMGNWTHQTPLVRKVVGNVMPFGLWWLNSLRWLYRLPVSHPIKTGILSALFVATKPAREAEGQGTGAPHAVPGFLQGSIDPEKTLGIPIPFISKGSRVAPTYYSPGGTLGTDAPITLAEQILPYITEPFGNLLGVNLLTQEKQRGPKGEELSPWQKALNFAVSIAAGPLPFSTQAQRLLTQGGKPYGNANLVTDLIDQLGGPATTKPGTQRSFTETLAKSFAPTRTIRPGKATGQGSATLDPLQEHRLREAEAQAQQQLSDPLVKQRIEEAERSAAGH